MSADLAPALYHELEKLRKKVMRLGKSIKQNENTKAKLIAKIARTTEHMDRLTARLNKRKACLREYEKTIKEVELAHGKIVQSAMILLEMTKDAAGDSDPEDVPLETYGDAIDETAIEKINNPFDDEDDQEAWRKEANFHKFHDGEPAETSVWKVQADEDHHLEEAIRADAENPANKFQKALDK